MKRPEHAYKPYVVSSERVFGTFKCQIVNKMARTFTRQRNTEEAFLFAGFIEFVKCWSSSKKSRIVIESVNGQAFMNFSWNLVPYLTSSLSLKVMTRTRQQLWTGRRSTASGRGGSSRGTWR